MSLQVGQSMKKLQQPRVPAFKGKQEDDLHVMVRRRYRLWKRLIEIGAYWEKVSGSRSLFTVTSAAQASARQAASTTGGEAAAGGDVQARSNVGNTTAEETRKAAATEGREGGGGGEGASRAELSSAKDAAAALEKLEQVGKVAVDMAKSAQKDAQDAGGVQQATPSEQSAESAGQGSTTVTSHTPSTGSKGKGKATEAPAEPSTAAAAVTSGAEKSTARPSMSSPRLSQVSDADSFPLSAADTSANVAILAGEADAEAEVDVDVGIEAEPAFELRTQSGLPEAPGLGQGRQAAGAQANVSSTSGRPSAEPREEPRPTKRLKRATSKTREELARQPSERIERDGVEGLTCVYCGEETGPRVTKHLEECYRQVNARWCLGRAVCWLHTFWVMRCRCV